jgi:hypothetical protein
MPSKGNVPRTCEQCGWEFFVYPSRLRQGPARFCSRECQKKTPEQKRLKQNALAAAWRAKHPERAKESAKRFRDSHRAELTANMRAQRSEPARIRREARLLPPLELIPTEAAYIAGFFDGEGMVAISKDRHCGKRRADRKSPNVNASYSLVIKVSQSERPVIEWIKDRIGGWISVKNFSKTQHRIHYVLVQKASHAKRILEALLPYLMVKRTQAEAGIEFQNRQIAHKNRYEAGRLGPIPKTPEDVAYKEHYFKLLQRLKRQ